MTAQARQKLEAEVLDFVRAEVPPPRPRLIGLDTELERDLRMIWEDADTFLLNFFTRFDVDHSGFALTSYITVAQPLFSLRRRRPPVRPLTVEMLVDAAEAKSWAKAERAGGNVRAL